MHLRLFYTSYFAFQGRRTASDFSPASMLSHWFPITLELFWREADYTSTAFRSLWPRLFLSAPPSHTRLTFCCSCCSVASTCIWVSLLFASIFDSGFLSHTSACRMCVNVWERGGRENGYTWWIMHGVVSWSARQTVGTANCPSGPFFFLFFFPHHTVVKQTTSAGSSPISTLLLLYSHRQDQSPSIHNCGTSLTAWPLWITPAAEIFNTFYHHMVTNSSDDITNSYKCVCCVWALWPRWDF